MDSYKLHFVPLGGVVGVTKNMYVYELYKNDHLQDILIVDCGIGFPQEKELGVDFVIPDISYLTHGTNKSYESNSINEIHESNKTNKIRAILLSHGHEDHTSALPYHYDDLGRPEVYASKLTAVFVEYKFKDFGLKINVNQVKYEQEYRFGDFKVKFIRVTHSIPDTMHILITTPVGTIYHGPDFKLDLTPPYGLPPDFYSITKAGHDGILCLLSDCLGAERPGLTLSESVVGQTFEDEMRKTKGKFVMTTFSSNISRIRQCVEAAIKFNRRIVFLGRSMRDNTKLAAGIGYLPVPDGFLIKEEEVMKLQPNKVCLIVAGSQGQFGSALSKLATKQNPNIKIKPGDKIIFSSDPIPGNENEVYATIEDLVIQGADVYYSDIADQLHSSGHGNQEDLKYLMRFTNPNYFIPIGGTVRHQKQYQKLAMDLGYKREQVFTLNEGETVWFDKRGCQKGDVVETRNIYVDAYGVGDVGNIVLRDRKTLAAEGIVFVLIVTDGTGKMAAEPKIVSRGFVFEKGEDILFKKASVVVEKRMKPRSGLIYDPGAIKRDIISSLEDFFYDERGRRPLVIVEVVQI